jgi:UbiD family decarboxylase
MSITEVVPAKEQEQAKVAHRDLRGFMETLDSQGQLMQVRDEVMPEPDVRGYLRAASQMENDGPAIVFDNIKGYKGQKLLINTHGSWANTALLFGMPKKTVLIDQFYELANRWDRYPG